MVYAIFCRYEYLSKNGKIFTDYYRTDSLYDSENEAKECIKKLKDFTKSIDKITKLKHEYIYKYVDETLFPQPKMHRPKGRPKKIDIEYLDTVIKTLNKKEQIEIDKEIACYLYNDETAKEYISSKIKDTSKYIRYWYDDNNKLFIFLKDKN